MSMFPAILPDGRWLCGTQLQIAHLLAVELSRLPPVYVSASRPFGDDGPSFEPQVGGLLIGRTVWRDRWYARWSANLPKHRHAGSSTSVVDLCHQIEVVRIDTVDTDPLLFSDQVVTESFVDPGGLRIDLREFDYSTRIVPDGFVDWTDCVPFLEAIAENPADRQHRQVYADYLEDQGLINAAVSLRELIQNPPLWWAHWWRHSSIETDVLAER